MMKQIIKMGLFSLILGCTACQKSNVKFETVNAEAFAKVITDDKVQILDVRSTEEYAEGHIANSKNIDVKQDYFEDRAIHELDKDETVALYCRSGRRSKIAAEKLTKAGFKVVELGGGFNEWKDGNYTIEK